MVPVGLAGLADQNALQWRLAVRGEQRLAGQRVTRVARGLDQHRLAAERGEDMAVRRIAGHGDGDPVARLEHRQKGQDERTRRAGGDDDPPRIDGKIVGFAIMAGDPLPERGDPERGGVVDPHRIERGMGGRIAVFGAEAAGWPTSM